MNTRDIEAAAERWRNRQEIEHNEGLHNQDKPEPDYVSDGFCSWNALEEENRNLRALVELLKVECGFLHVAIKQRDERIAKLEGQC